jgi:flagellar hook protein FlgE
MSLTSYSIATTAMNNASTAINVIGNNLANMSTTAYKSENATFVELLSGVSTTDDCGNSVAAGQGCKLNGIISDNTQGTITSTENELNVAINGNGYFAVDANGTTAYTRNGAFSRDGEGSLVSSDGFSVMGYLATDGVLDTSQVTAITIDEGSAIPAKATSAMAVTANLNADAAVGDAFSSSVAIYDSLGNAHSISVTYTKTDFGWNWSATIPAEDVGGSSTDNAVEVGSGDLEFGSDGTLISPSTSPVIAIEGFTEGASDQELSLNLYDDGGDALLTSYASDSAATNTSQNGYASSYLSSLSIDSAGEIVGTTDSGRTVTLAQLVLANFNNEDGLEKFSGSTFIAGASAGTPSIGTAETEGRGSIEGSSLEASNVDMAESFVSLIQAQRAYQTASRIITTTDEMVKDAVNLKA